MTIIMDKKQEVVNKELSKNTKVLLDSMGKLNKSILDKKSVTFQKRLSIKKLLKIYEPMLREYLKDENEEYQQQIREGFDKKSKEMISAAKTGSTEKDLSFYRMFYSHLVEVTTTRKTTMDKLEALWL